MEIRRKRKENERGKCMTKKERTGRQIIRETLRIAWLVQAGAYTLMQRLNELPQDKTINIMLSLTLWAFGLVGLWFDFLVPEPVAPEADKEKAEKDRKTAFALGVAGTAAILVIFVMQVITGSIIPFAQG